MVKFQGQREMIFEVMVKFYAEQDDNCYTGLPLSFLVLDPVTDKGKGKGKKTNHYEVHYH